MGYEGTTKSHFSLKGIKTSSAMYRDTIFIPIVKDLGQTMLKNKDWSFQNDSAPGHRGKPAQGWLKLNIKDFISPDDWPSSSPGLSPLDNFL